MKLIDIDKENGELIMQHMETALSFKNWNQLLGAKYDSRFKKITALYSCEADTDVHRLSLKMLEDGKLMAYSHTQFHPEGFLQYFESKKTGYVLTSHTDRLMQVFERVMTADLALKLLETGVYLESKARGVADGE